MKTLISKITLGLIVTILSLSTCFSQSDALSRANQYFDNNDCDQAIPLYIELINEGQVSAELYYNLAICYTEDYDEIIALPYFEKSKDLGGVIVENHNMEYDEYLDRFFSDNIDFNIARGNHLLSKFDLAIAYYKLYLLNSLDFQDVIDTENFLFQAESGKQISENQLSKGKISNLGIPFNSKYSDYGGLFYSDYNSLIFTRREPRGPVEYASQHYNGEYRDDIFITRKSNSGSWFEPYRLSENINSDQRDEVAINLSHNNTRLIFQNQKGYLYESIKEGKYWSYPEKLPSFINRGGFQTGIAVGENFMVLATNRAGSLGGQDLFISYKEEGGAWGHFEPMDENINTEFDETTPFIDDSTNTLYFSSTGHNSIGGYDVFKTTLNPITKKWENPVNMGYGVNSPSDDMYYVYDGIANKALFSSKRNEGLGGFDIYQVDYDKLGNSEIDEFLTVLEGKVFDTKGEFLAINLEILDANYPTLEGVMIESNTQGEFRYEFGRSMSYIVSITEPGYYHIDTVISAYNVEKVEIELEAITEGEIHAAQSLTFERNKADLSVDGKKELDKYYELLLVNPSLGLEIAGHTEVGGTFESNIKLSQKRADAVKEYLVAKGIDEDRLLAMGYGSKFPLTRESSQAEQNRRTEFIFHRIDLESDENVWKPYYSN